MKDTDIAWQEFINNGKFLSKKEEKNQSITIPKSSNIYISTQTKIAYINKTVDLNHIFWKIPILSYHSAQEGVLKKQMKTVCNNIEESKKLDKMLAGEKENCVDVNIIKMINNPTARKIKYKDIRKINIGL